MIAVAAVVGDELKRLRLREGMSQAEVGVALGIAREIVARRERGKHLCTLASIAAQARACGGSLAHVLVRVDVATGALRQGGGR